MEKIEDILAALQARDPTFKIGQAVELCASHGHHPRLVRIVLNAGEERQRAFAAWILGRSAQKGLWTPDENEAGRLLSQLENESQEMIKRAVVDIFQYAPITEEMMSPLADICISYIRNPKEAIAVRAFSITVFMRIVKDYPALFNEIEDVLMELREKGSAALRVRCRRAFEQMEEIS